jgi:indole-3-glycerol phosphate synthase
MTAAKHLELETVVEVRNEQELERALEAGAEIIGVNSRNLETLEVDERVPKRIVPLIPPHLIAIWESGIECVEDVQRAAERGADAVLVGSALSRSSDPAELVSSLSQVARASRHG